MTDEPISAAEAAAAEFWKALAEDDDRATEARLSRPALAQVGAGAGIAARVRDVLGLGPRECGNVAVLRDVPLKGFVDIGDSDDAHRIDFMIADLVDDVNDERLVPGIDAASTGTWTLDVVQRDGRWFVDWGLTIG